MADTGTLGIYSTGNVAHVLIQRPLTREQAGSEALSDVDYMFDGLNQHPNMLVALPAAAVATPISLWKQGAAMVRGLSPRTIREADAKLSAAANQTKPHQELAFQVAQQLAPQTSQPVMLVRQVLPPGAEDDAALMQCVARGTLPLCRGAKPPAATSSARGPIPHWKSTCRTPCWPGTEGLIRGWRCASRRALRCSGRATASSSTPARCNRSQGRKFTEWAAQDARLFRAELQQCYRDLSAAMVDQLVGHGVVPPGRKPVPTFAEK